MDDTFTRLVHFYQRNPDTLEKVLDAAGHPIPEKEIGTFTFRVPTVHDDLLITAARQRMIAQVGDPQFVSVDFFLKAEAHATIPRQVVESPAGWDWQKLYNPRTMLEIYHAYQEGLEDVRKKNTSPF